jgi:hypothetical protein
MAEFGMTTDTASKAKRENTENKVAMLDVVMTVPDCLLQKNPNGAVFVPLSGHAVADNLVTRPTYGKPINVYGRQCLSSWTSKPRL